MGSCHRAVKCLYSTRPLCCSHPRLETNQWTRRATQMPELARHYDNSAHAYARPRSSQSAIWGHRTLVWAGPVMCLLQGVRRVIHLPFAAHFVFRLEHLATSLQCLQRKDLTTTLHKRLLKEWTVVLLFTSQSPALCLGFFFFFFWKLSRWRFFWCASSHVCTHERLSWWKIIE